MSAWIWIAPAIVVAVLLWIIMAYNRLVPMRQHCNQAFADIDVQLRQRHDLVPNLVETVKGYAGHERATLEAVVQARNSAVAARGPAAQAAAENALSGALRQLFALSEAYPKLKADANFRDLQTKLAAIENKLAEARRSSTTRCRRTIPASNNFPPCSSLRRLDLPRTSSSMWERIGPLSNGLLR